MSVADLHDVELVWPSLGPRDVIVTGTFDQWSASIPLVRGDAGFSGTVKVPWGQKVTYKFIVDGHWRCREDQPQEDDGHGNVNNVLQTPERPPQVSAHVLPARLSIPLRDPYGDVENMVTAVEFLTPADPLPMKGSLPLPIPYSTVEGLTPVSESILNTAAATEGHVSPASETLAEPVIDVSTLPINDSAPLPSVDEGKETHDSYNISTYTHIQSTKEELSTSALVSETAEEVVSVPLESAAPQANRSHQVAQATPASTNLLDAPPAPAPVTVSESTTKQHRLDPIEAQAHCQQITSPVSVGYAITPTSSTLTHKKRRSLFARIKHIFDKGHEKQGKKEKNRH